MNNITINFINSYINQYYKGRKVWWRPAVATIGDQRAQFLLFQSNMAATKHGHRWRKQTQILYLMVISLTYVTYVINTWMFF